MIGGDSRRHVRDEHGHQPQSGTPPWRMPAEDRFVARTVAFVGPSCASLAVTAGQLIHEISQQGHRVLCFAPDLDDTAAANALTRFRAELRRIHSFRQGLSPIGDQLGILRLARAFRETRPDVVAGYSPKGAVLGGIAARMAGVPHVVSMIGELGRGFEEAPERPSPLRGRCRRRCCGSPSGSAILRCSSMRRITSSAASPRAPGAAAPISDQWRRHRSAPFSGQHPCRRSIAA